MAIGIVVMEMFLVAEEEDSRCSRFNPPLLFIYLMAWKHMAYNNNSDSIHACLKQQLEKKFENNFCQYVYEEEKGNENWNGNYRAFCVTRKRKN